MFLAIEGIDGAGKTTLVRGLADELGRSASVLVDRLAPEMVGIFKSLSDQVTGIEGSYQTAFPPDLRHQTYIVEALVRLKTKRDEYDAHDWVIFDRWLGTNEVYLGPLGNDSGFWQILSDLVPAPDYYFWIRTPAELAFERLQQKHDWMTRHVTKRQLIADLAKWNHGFERLARQQPMIELDGTLPIETLVAACLTHLPSPARLACGPGA